MEDRDADYRTSFKGVCKKCKCVIQDSEPHSYGGYFYHPDNGCDNSGETFVTGDKEMEPFVRKRIRRLDKRNTKNFYKRRNARN